MCVQDSQTQRKSKAHSETFIIFLSFWISTFLFCAPQDYNILVNIGIDASVF